MAGHRRHPWLVSALACLLLAPVTAAAESVSVADLRTRVEDARRDLERFRDGFRLPDGNGGLLPDGQGPVSWHYAELRRRAHELAVPLPDRPGILAPRELSPEHEWARDFFGVIDGATADARGYLERGEPSARDANEAARRFIRDARALRSAAPSAEIPAADVAFRSNLYAVKLGVEYEADAARDDVVRARRLGQAEFARLQDQAQTFTDRKSTRLNSSH